MFTTCAASARPPSPTSGLIQHHRPRILQVCGTLLLAAALWGVGQSARAASSTTVVEAVQLPAWVERHGQRRPAQPGQLLRESDKAVTADGARMLLRLPDRSVIKLGEQTQFQIETLASRQQGVAGPSEFKSTLRLITGVFRYATDYTSKALGNRRDINLKLTTATVGIRGTDFWSMTDAEHDAVCLFEGQVEVLRNAQPGIPLVKPGAFWVVFTGQPEKPAGQATPDQLIKFIDQAEMKYGSGVLLQGGRWRTVAAFLPSAAQAAGLRNTLQAAGYPAEMVFKARGHEVRINQLATREDAEALLARLKAQTSLGVTQGRVALAAD